MKGLILAVQFLTRIPIPIEVEADDRAITHCFALFPVVSMIIGALVGLIHDIYLDKNPLVGAFLALLLWVLLTGGLHIDGLTDTFDGFLANRNREETLRIMSDPNIGSYGALSLIILILGKFIFLYTVELNWIDLVLICGMSRLCVLMDIDLFPTAKQSGMGYYFKQRVSHKLTMAEFIIMAVVLFFYSPILLVAFAILILKNYWFNGIFVRKLGGLTGDIYGFTMEFSELLALIILGVIRLWI